MTNVDFRSLYSILGLMLLIVGLSGCKQTPTDSVAMAHYEQCQKHCICEQNPADSVPIHYLRNPKLEAEEDSSGETLPYNRIYHFRLLSEGDSDEFVMGMVGYPETVVDSYVWNPSVLTSHVWVYRLTGGKVGLIVITNGKIEKAMIINPLDGAMERVNAPRISTTEP